MFIVFYKDEFCSSFQKLTFFFFQFKNDASFDESFLSGQTSETVDTVDTSLEDNLHKINFNNAQPDKVLEFVVDPQSNELIEVVEVEHTKKKGKYDRTENFDVSAALLDDVIGVALVNYYDSGKNFNSFYQSYLVDIISRRLLKQFGE